MTATSAAKPDDQGLASGIFNTSQQVGGAVGLAVLAAIASTVTANAHATSHAQALVTGYTTAFAVAAAITLAAVAVVVALLPARPTPAPRRSGSRGMPRRHAVPATSRGNFLASERRLMCNSYCFYWHDGLMPRRVTAVRPRPRDHEDRATARHARRA